jgi:beta-galactosidase
MSVSRRTFLQVSALAASGAVLATMPAVEEDAQGQVVGSAPARLTLNINQDWQFFRPDSAGAAPDPQVPGDQAQPPANARWQTVNLPHTVRLEPRDVGGGQNYQGICWYKRALNVQPGWNGRIVYLKFQGAMQVADVWLNGAHLTTHYGGYLPFTIDISKNIRVNGPNELIVRLDNSDNPEVPPGKPQNQLDFCYFGGLYRNVDLLVLDPLHVTDPMLADTVAGGGIFVTYPTVAPDVSIVQVQTDVANESGQSRTFDVVQSLTDSTGQLAATASVTVTVPAGSSSAPVQQITVNQPKLWHPQSPHLYFLRTTIHSNGRVVDDVNTQIGIRSIEFDQNRGLLINGETFNSIGANRHQDHPYVGNALPASAHYRDAFKIRDAGFTSYRIHYPQDPSFMDACDELGILAIVSNPGWQFMGDDTFKQRALQNAREMVRRDRNHPSVILWEAELNESDSSSIAAQLYQIVHSEYPGPQCYTSGNEISAPGLRSWDVTYRNWDSYNGLPTDGRPGPPWIREWGDYVDNWGDQQGPARVERSWGEVPMLVQASSHLQSLNKYFQPGTRPAGADLWAAIDYPRGYEHQPFLGCPLDTFRLPKFDYYLLQSQRPAQQQLAAAGSGPMIFIANYATNPSPTVVTVFSNCDQVRLIQNGKEVATQNPDAGYQVPHPPFTFQVGEFSGMRNMLFGNAAVAGASSKSVGELRAQGLIGGNVVAEHVVNSPGASHAINLVLDTCGIDPVADGSDWVRVYAHIVDSRGTTYPFADDYVTFSVSGEGTLINDERMMANPVRAEAGIATALVRMTQTPGNVTVTAMSPGLTQSAVQFKSQPLSTQAVYRSV